MGAKRVPPFVGPQCQVMLDTKPLVHGHRAVVAMDGAGNGNGALGREDALALIRRNLQMIRDIVELLPGHLVHRSGIQRAPVAHLEILDLR